MIIQGAGFNRSAVYTCVFTGLGMLTEQLATIAHLSSSTSLTCSSPRSTMSLLWGMEMQAAVSITEDDVTIPLVGNPTSAYFTYSVTSWTSATPLQHYTTGGATLTVAGSGFTSSGWKYRAEFSAGRYMASSTCRPVTTFTLHCQIPGMLACAFTLWCNFLSSN